MRILGSICAACVMNFGLISCMCGISLEEAINKAVEHSAKLEAQRHYTQTATYQKYTSFSAFLPTLNTNYIYSYNIPSVSKEYALNTFNLVGRVNIFKGFQDYIAIKESKKNLERKNLDLKNTFADVRLQAKLAYISILQTKALLQTSLESKTLLTQQLKKANSFYQQGLRAKNEVLTMELQLSSAIITFESAKQNLEYALNALSNLIGMRVNIDDIEEIKEVQIYEYKEQDLLTQALRNNPNYLYLKSQLESARLALKSAIGSFLPQLDISGVKYWYIDGAGAANYTYGLQSQIGLNVSLNLFNGLSDGWQYQIKRYELLAMQNNLTQYARDLELDLYALLRDYESAKHQLKIAQDSLKKAKENYTIINNRYLQNISTYTELINAQLLLTSMQTNINQARYNIISIQSNIERIVNP